MQQQPRTIARASLIMDVLQEESFEVSIRATPAGGISNNGAIPPWRETALEQLYFHNLLGSRSDESKYNALIFTSDYFLTFRDFPGSIPIIVTQNTTRYPKATHFPDLSRALAHCYILRRAGTMEKIYVVGGAGLINEAVSLPECACVHVTKSKNHHQCDTFVGMPLQSEYHLVNSRDSSTIFGEDEQTNSSLTYERYKRRPEAFGVTARYDLQNYSSVFPLVSTVNLCKCCVIDVVLRIAGIPRGSAAISKYEFLRDSERPCNFACAPNDVHACAWLSKEHFDERESSKHFARISSSLAVDPACSTREQEEHAIIELDILRGHRFGATCQFSVRNKKLSCLMHLRSGHKATTVPFSTACCILLTKMMAIDNHLEARELMCVIGEQYAGGGT